MGENDKNTAHTTDIHEICVRRMENDDGRNRFFVCFCFSLAEINLLILDTGTVAAKNEHTRKKGLKFHFFFQK